jgi:nucleoside-diphosphate-sugar epimerase
MESMSNPGAILLTGATGFLGRYLLHDLLASGRRVAVLVREPPAAWGDRLHTPPVVLTGDLRAPRLGLRAADRDWLARHCCAVLHAAADVALRPSPGRDPWAVNVRGTQHVLELCADLGISEVHHVSTAFVCGDRPGPVAEDELECGQGFHNDYERSKFEAERLVRGARGVRATVYRPAVLVGDSRTGTTSSYHGFYRFLELAARLAAPPLPPAAPAGGGRRTLPLRLPFTGDEPRNLVPVDWVARAIVRLVNRPECHGRTYHLTTPTPVRVREIKDVAEAVLGIGGVSWAGADVLRRPTPLEERFLEQLREYWPYLGGDPVFDSTNTRAALPGLPPPCLDRALLTRLIRFAAADNWGRFRGRHTPAGADTDCTRYVEQFFPEALRRSTLARLPLDVVLGLDVQGAGGGRWSAHCRGGALLHLERGIDPDAEVVYRMDAATFAAIVRGRQTPPEAFLARRIDIDGDLEKALKLAVLFELFVKECPYEPPHPREAVDAAPLCA